MRLLKQLVAVAAVTFVGGQAIVAVKGNAWLTLIIGVLTAVVAVLVYGWVVRRTEHRAVTELARAGAVARIARGALIGFGMFAAVIINIAFVADYDVNGLGSVSGAVAILGLMAAAAVTEELLFRGVLFRVVEERTGTWLALVLTGGVFGLMHLLNADASIWGAICIVVEAGFMLAACYAATRNLWVPIGLHFGWNFAAGGIFSVVVSGTGQSEGLLATTMSGPTMVTGGDFGPEGSLYTVAAGVVLTLVFMWLAHRRGHIVPRRRRAIDVQPATATVS
ncbi:CPBP family intramembrane glutamic endopeptidase [Micromonospora inaquosa]|uniref:CPBP family intramembrane metalloprotease domain-containing protein n=1 Tax=Micromonospora inaquosa TaxID=2203716 RepID=A0A3N9W6K1_9ACTN|nr:CPBP family intramembrane glutamic endopeptidase [Micromonospora inaquosa]RQW96259.1 CPBP family intramembrane metalloprotease domain-containing protein [Micromonospora inaquosa]